MHEYTQTLNVCGLLFNMTIQINKLLIRDCLDQRFSDRTPESLFHTSRFAWTFLHRVLYRMGSCVFGLNVLDFRTTVLNMLTNRLKNGEYDDYFHRNLH